MLGTRYTVTVQVQPTKCGRAGVSTFGLTGDDPKPDHPKSPWCCFLVESGLITGEKHSAVINGHYANNVQRLLKTGLNRAKEVQGRAASQCRVGA